MLNGNPINTDKYKYNNWLNFITNKKIINNKKKCNNYGILM